MSLANMVYPAVLGVALSLLFLRLLVPCLRLHLLDRPNSRSSHSEPVPRGGGLAFVAISVIASLLALFRFGASPALLIPLLAFPLAAVGLLDDCFNLPVSWRYGVQLLTALLVVLISPLGVLTASFFPLFFLLVVAVTAIINFTNFMDGLDGLVAGCMTIALCAISLQIVVPSSVWVLIGALLGFLFWNWSPAKVFMGDVGSTFIGVVFAGLVLQMNTWSAALASILVATPLLGDACLCVTRRWVARQPVFQAHRLHLYQRLHQAGWSHARVASFYMGGTLVLGLALVCGGFPYVLLLAVVELVIGFWLDRHVAVPFSFVLDD